MSEETVVEGAPETVRLFDDEEPRKLADLSAAELALLRRKVATELAKHQPEEREGFVIVTDAELGDIKTFCEMILVYTHPKSLRGIKNDVMTQVMPLRRKVLKLMDESLDAKSVIVRRHQGQMLQGGAAQLPREKDETAADYNARWGRVLDELRPLERQVYYLPNALRIKLANVRTRDENGDWAEVERGEIALLGPMLITETAEKKD